MNSWWKSSSLIQSFVRSFIHSLTNPLRSPCLSMSRILEPQLVGGQSLGDKDRVGNDVAGAAGRGDPQASLVESAKLLGEGEAPEDTSGSHMAGPHLLVCVVWRALSGSQPHPTLAQLL